MTEVYRRKIAYPMAWKSAEVQGKTKFSLAAGAEVVEALDKALEATREVSVDAIARNAFAGRALEAFLEKLLQRLKAAHGVVVVTGLPGDRYTNDDFTRILWGLSLLMGEAVSQSAKGDRIGHVRHDPSDITDRGYRSTRELWFHTDTPDVLVLLSLQKAKSGGLSSVVSALALHNAILEKQPHLLDPLYRGHPYHRQGLHLSGQSEVTPHNVPVFCSVDGFVSCRYVRQFMTQAATHMGTPFPSDLREAMDLFNSLADDPEYRADFMLERGEILFINNYTALHARSQFEDYEEADRKRYLLRLWLNLLEPRPVSPHMEIYEGGGRGGIAQQEERKHVGIKAPMRLID